MADILENVQRQIEDLPTELEKQKILQESQTQHQLDEPTKAINKLSDQAEPNILTTPASVRDFGYVTWGEEHDVIKTKKWLSDTNFLSYYKLKTPYKDVKEIDEVTRFPEDGLYIDVSVPEIMFACKHLDGINEQFILSLIKNHLHTRSSFEHTYKLKWVDPKDKIGTELYREVSNFLDKVAQCKFETLIGELRTLPLSSDNTLKVVKELFVDNSKTLMEKLWQQRLQTFLGNLQKSNMAEDCNHFESIINLMFDRLTNQPDLAYYIANICEELTFINRSFRKQIIQQCQNEFECLLKDNSTITNITDEDKMNKRCQGIISLIGELHNKKMITTKIIDYCLEGLVNKRTDKHLKSACELLSIVGKTIQDISDKLPGIMKTIDSIVRIKPHTISDHIKELLEDTVKLSERNWEMPSTPETIEQTKKDKERLKVLRYFLSD